MSAARWLILCWVALVMLSICTVLLAHSNVALSGVILLLAVGKAWLITEGFMELRRAPRLWRGLMLSWATVLAAWVGLTLALIS